MAEGDSETSRPSSECLRGLSAGGYVQVFKISGHQNLGVGWANKGFPYKNLPPLHYEFCDNHKRMANRIFLQISLFYHQPMSRKQARIISKPLQIPFEFNELIFFLTWHRPTEAVGLLMSCHAHEVTESLGCFYCAMYI